MTHEPRSAAALPVLRAIAGVMTFVVNQDGVVWHKDFGAETEAGAATIVSFDPDSTWTRVD